MGLNILAAGFVFTGIAVLAVSLLPVFQLVKLLPTDVMRRRWYAMTVLIMVFIVFYLGYAVIFRNNHTQNSDLIAPLVFFFGAWFVWMTARLSYKTAIDLQRIGRLEQENILDPLTGVYNRRYLDRRLLEEVARALRYSQELSVLMLDIDHFKNINDEYGHQAGDNILISLGELLGNELRQSDILARYGGEEFLVLMPGMPAQPAMVVAERMRSVVESKEFVVENEVTRHVIRLTVSIGEASFGNGIDYGKQLVSAADEALYRAKEEGRNRVQMAP